jgi:hypothetical protein
MFEAYSQVRQRPCYWQFLPIHGNICQGRHRSIEAIVRKIPACFKRKMVYKSKTLALAYIAINE